MKRLILLHIVCCCFLVGKADYEMNTDSLIQVFQNLPHDSTRLVALNNIIRIEQNNPKCIQFSDTLMKEALFQKDDKYAGLAAYYHLLYYYNHNKTDSVAKWITQMEPHVHKSDIWDYFFDAKRFQIDLYTYNEEYERAISEANKMKQQAFEKNNHRGLVAAHQCLSNAYIGSQRWEEGIKALEEAYKLLAPDANPVVRISVLSQLVSVTKEMKNNSKLFKYLQELESTLYKHIKENPSLKDGFSDVFLFNELFYAYYYLNTQQPQRAYEHLVKAKEYQNENNYFMYQVLYFDTYARYYKYIGEYQKASDYIDTTLVMLKDNYASDYAEQLLVKAKIWVKAGDSEKAVPLYQKALAIKDSASMSLANNQMEQIKSSYQLDKINMEQQRHNNRIRLIFLAVIIVVLFVLFIFMFRLAMVRKALKRSENEIRKAAATVRETNEIKNRFLSNMSYNIRTPLNNVVGFSQLIACEPNIDEGTRKEYSNIIHQSSEKLMRLVNDVLDLSRLEAQMMKFQIQVYDAVELCNEACYMARMKNETTGIQVRFYTETKSQPVRTDTARLTQMILSTLVYPYEYQQDQKQERVIRFILSRKDEMLHFQIINSPLADNTFVSQETVIRHEINQLLLTHFGGTYQINTQTPEGPEIVFTYPIASDSE